MLITGKKDALSLPKTVGTMGTGVIDELQAQSWKHVITAGIGCDQTSIYVVMSRTFQTITAWLDLDTVRKTRSGAIAAIEALFLSDTLPHFMKRFISIAVSLIILSVIYSKLDFPKLLQVFHNCSFWWMAISLGMVVPLTMLTLGGYSN